MMRIPPLIWSNGECLVTEAIKLVVVLGESDNNFIEILTTTPDRIIETDQGKNNLIFIGTYRGLLRRSIFIMRKPA